MNDTTNSSETTEPITIKELLGSEGGVWCVVTRDSRHFFDLDKQTVVRVPAALHCPCWATRSVRSGRSPPAVWARAEPGRCTRTVGTRTSIITGTGPRSSRRSDKSRPPHPVLGRTVGSRCDVTADGPPRAMRYPPYAMPALGGVKQLGIFSHSPDGFDRLEESLDLFHAQGVALIIQLEEALLPRGTARSTDIDHVRRLLRLRQQALLVCTDDLGRATTLHRAGVRGESARMVRPNVVHLDGGFRTRLSNDDIFTVVGPSPTSPEYPSTGLPFGGRGGLSGRVGLAVCPTEIDVAAVVRELAPKLLISAGHGRFRDESFSYDVPGGTSISSRVIVFGDRGGQRVNHAFVHLNDGTVRLLPEREGEGEA
jgi:hypothetical protein